VDRDFRFFYTGGKFAIGINNTSPKLVAKFAAGVVVPAAILLPVLLTPGGKFATGVVDTGSAP
jgi:hypothetical protein